MSRIRFREISDNLMKSYLTGRKRCVRIENTESDFLSMGYGVPQRTVLGLLLFNLYIDELYLIESYKADNWKNQKTKAENDFLIL